MITIRVWDRSGTETHVLRIDRKDQYDAASKALSSVSDIFDDPEDGWATVRIERSD